MKGNRIWTVEVQQLALSSWRTGDGGEREREREREKGEGVNGRGGWG